LHLHDGTPTEAAGAVIVSAEDGDSDTIRPRFDAAGGDPNRVLLLGDDKPFAIPGDIPRLDRAVKQLGAALVVVDPVMAFLSGNVNSNRDQDVRRALTPLKRMAERTGAAVVLVCHLNKTPGGNPLYRGGDSIGIIGAARSGMVVGKHPDDAEIRVVAGQKNNLSLTCELRLWCRDSGEWRRPYRLQGCIGSDGRPVTQDSGGRRREVSFSRS
jgi:putative DNA primase/helicase